MRTSMIVSERCPVTLCVLPKMELAPLPRLRVSLPTASTVSGPPGLGTGAKPLTATRLTCPRRHCTYP